MICYEYKTVTKEIRPLDHFLNKYGQAGWELVSFIHVPSTKYSDYYWLYTFKRAIT